jgi:hypothetical protein
VLRARVVLGVGVVAEPVVDLELDPGSREQVERVRRDEALAGEELTADHARARLQQLGL